MNSRFPLLSTLSIALRVVGVLLFLSGMACIIHYDEVIYKFLSLLIIVLAIFVCVIGEIVGVIFAIEDNTRKTADLLKEIVVSFNNININKPIEQSVKSPPKFIA